MGKPGGIFMPAWGWGCGANNFMHLSSAPLLFPLFSSKTLQLIIFTHGARAAVKWLLISLTAAGCYRV